MSTGVSTGVVSVSLSTILFARIKLPESCYHSGILRRQLPLDWRNTKHIQFPIPVSTRGRQVASKVLSTYAVENMGVKWWGYRINEHALRFIFKSPQQTTPLVAYSCVISDTEWGCWGRSSAEQLSVINLMYLRKVTTIKDHSWFRYEHGLKYQRGLISWKLSIPKPNRNLSGECVCDPYLYNLNKVA